MWIRTVDYILAAAGLAGHLTVLVLLVRRRLLGRLPVFALLIAFYLVRSGLLLIAHFPRDWPRSYWLLIYLDPALQLLVMLSLGWVASRLSRARVLLAVPLMLVIGLAVAWYVGPSRYTPQNLGLKLSIFVSALWLMVAASLLLLLRRGDPAMKKLSLGIALGFAAYSGVNIATEIVHMHFSLHPQPALFTGLSFLRALVYLGCLTGWSILLYKDRSCFTTILT